MQIVRLFAFLIGMTSFATLSDAQEFKLVEVASIASLPIGQPAPQTIAFSDHKNDKLADPMSRLIRFSDWAHTRVVQKQFLGLFPNYDEPLVTPAGGKPFKKKLHVYVAEARFELKKRAQTIDLARYASIPFLERIDPAIKHWPVTADDALPNKNPQSASRNPERRWCEGSTVLVCIQSRYQLEGRLPVGIMLVNKLREGGRKIADYIEFQSELRVVPAAEIDQTGFKTLTGVDAAIVGALEQNIFFVNQVMQFGKLLAVFQPRPSDPERTIVTTFIVLGIDSDILEKRKEYAEVPVLRNLIPAQVLAGNSSFNTGSSISAGLPNYSRNRLKAIAEILERE